MRKTVHIVVEFGLVQAVYADEGLDIDIVIYDLDNENREELAKTVEAVNKLPDKACQMY